MANRKCWRARAWGEPVGRGRGAAGLICYLLFAICYFASPGSAQQQVNPVYTDDSPMARETLARVAEFVAGGNKTEAVRELQKLLDEQGDRVVGGSGGGDTLVSVRGRVHAAILASEPLLELYRATEGPRGAQDLASGDFTAVERSRLLTSAGLEACLRVAQTDLEACGFEAARLALEQLENHPDRKSGAGAKDAATMLAQVASYVNRPEVWERADRWAKEAGLPAPERREVACPPALKAAVRTMSGDAASVRAEGLPGRPLWSARIESAPTNEPEPAPGEEDTTPVLWTLPVVVGDTIYVNDGTAIAARDRFTLQARWTHPTGVAESNPVIGVRPGFRGQLTPPDEPLALAVAGRTVVASGGTARGPYDQREGDTMVFALDGATGRTLWTRTLARLDPQLEAVMVRGAPMIDGGTVVVSARKISQGRRISSAYLVGLSMEDGGLLWVRSIASAGANPWGRGMSRVPDSCLLSRGVVYGVDTLGVSYAVEATSGRPVWVRPMPIPGGMAVGAVEMGMTWQWSTPIADGATIVALAPDRSEVLRLDSATGATVGRRSAGALGDPQYLVRVGDSLGAVGRDAVVFVPLAEMEKALPHKSRSFVPGIGGRVVPAGDRLAVPRPEGVALIDPANPTVDGGLLKLERVGNVLPLDSQLLVLEGRQMHSYLTWEVAERLLSARMAADPADAEPAVTYAELAYRAQHPERIGAAADAALSAIEKSAGTEPARLSRKRLFEVLRAMAEYTESRWDIEKAGAPAPAPERPRRTPAMVQRKPPTPMDLPVLDQASLAQVVERLGRAAQTPDERVTHLMVLGRLRDAEGSGTLAAEAYQKVLGDPALSQALWRGPIVAVRAELEAARRIRTLVIERGAAAYAGFENQAAAEMRGLASSAPEALEDLARRYPAATVSATALMKASELHETAGRVHAAVADLREGLASAETAYSAGATRDPAALGELGGRLVTRLQKLDQVFAAAQLLARLRSQYPELALTDRGTALDGAAVSQELVRRLAGLQRLPRVGPEVKSEAQAVAGWSIMLPASRRELSAPEHLMMISPSQGQVALWGLSGGGGGEAAGRLQMLWSRSYEGQAPKLLRVNPESVYLMWDRRDGPEGTVVERIATVTGETRWKTEAFRTLFAADPAFQRRLEQMRPIIAPIDGAQKLTDVLVVLDEQATVIVERSGRAAAFDPATGKFLWHVVTPVTAVHDVDVVGGVVAIGGATEPAVPGDGPMPPSTPVVLALDAHSGQPLQRIGGLSSSVRWVRLAGVGEQAPALIVGLDDQVRSFDVARGTPNWSITAGGAQGSIDAWVMNERLFLLSEPVGANTNARTLWIAPLATGKLGEKPLETYEHLAGPSPIYASRSGPKLAMNAFSTTRGVCVFDAQGTLVGMDALEGSETEDGGVLPPAVSESYFVTADVMPRQGERGQNVYSIHLMDTMSAALKSDRAVTLELPPKKIALLDGKILITAGANTVVYSAPVADGK